jgi:hypothetical protein
MKTRTMWKYRRPLAKIARPLAKVAAVYYAAKHAVRPKRSPIQKHWGKAVMAGAGVGLGYLIYRMGRHEEYPSPAA